MNMHLEVRHADSAAALPKLADFPDFVAARDKLRQIAAEFNEAAAELVDIDKNLELLKKARDRQIDEAARARIEDKQTPLRSVSVKNRADAQLKVDVARQALMLQTEIYEEIKNRRSSEILARARPAHEKLARSVLDAAVALSAALEAEEKFRVELARDGVVSTISMGAGSIFTVAPHAIRRALDRRNWSSPLNYFGRAVLGDAWHATR